MVKLHLPLFRRFDKQLYEVTSIFPSESTSVIFSYNVLLYVRHQDDQFA